MTEQTAIFSAMPAQPSTPFIYKVFVVMAMMILIGGSLTGVMTYMNVGYSDSFSHDWLSSFLAAATVMPLGFIMMGVISKFIEKLMPTRTEKIRNLLIGVVMACIMEAIMSLATAVNNIGFASHSDLFTAWLSGFLAALPLGLTIIITISMTIKPAIVRFLKH